MNTQANDAGAYFILTAWCTVTKTWQSAPGRFDSPDHAKRVATERGIYRVVYVCDGRQCELESFALVGDD